jgi:hypothetical protein
MSRKIDTLKDEVKKLSPTAFDKFATWVYNHAAKLQYEAQADDSTGISHRDVLREFERHNNLSRRKPDIWEGEVVANHFGSHERSECGISVHSDPEG